MVMLSEDRRRYGIIPMRSVRENASLSSLEKFFYGGTAHPKKEAEVVGMYFDKMSVNRHQFIYLKFRPDVNAAGRFVQNQYLWVAHHPFCQKHLLLVLNENFLSTRNITNIAVQLSVATILAYGEMVLIVSGLRHDKGRHCEIRHKQRVNHIERHCNANRNRYRQSQVSCALVCTDRKHACQRQHRAGRQIHRTDWYV